MIFIHFPTARDFGLSLMSHSDGNAIAKKMGVQNSF
jgi:hypothetical protein